MKIDAPNFDRFVRSVHRRMTLVRIAERIGVCVAIASGAAMILLPIRAWRGESTFPLALVMLAGGALTGIAWGTVRRPEIFDSTIEADRQLDLHDLLATALMLRKKIYSDMDAWQRAVIHVAEQR